MSSLLLFLLLPQVWIIIGIVLIIIEIFEGNFISLPSGLSALFTAFSLYIDGKDIFTDYNILNHWGIILIYFFCFSILFVFLLRKIFRKKYDKNKDINIY